MTKSHPERKVILADEPMAGEINFLLDCYVLAYRIRIGEIIMCDALTMSCSCFSCRCQSEGPRGVGL